MSTRIHSVISLRQIGCGIELTYGDIIGWDQSNRAYIMTHDLSGIDWKHYKHPLPENVYDVYMRYWKDVEFA